MPAMALQTVTSYLHMASHVNAIGSPSILSSLVAPVVISISCVCFSIFPPFLSHILILIISKTSLFPIICCTNPCFQNTITSLIMSGPNMPTRFYQDTHLFRPKHANIFIDHHQITIPGSLPQRPKNFNTFGRECAITLNTFNVVKTPNTVVHQYDVSSRYLSSP